MSGLRRDGDYPAWWLVGAGRRRSRGVQLVEGLRAEEWAEKIGKDVLACFIGRCFSKRLDRYISRSVDQDRWEGVLSVDMVTDGLEGGGDGVFVCDVTFYRDNMIW